MVNVIATDFIKHTMVALTLIRVTDLSLDSTQRWQEAFIPFITILIMNKFSLYLRQVLLHEV